MPAARPDCWSEAVELELEVESIGVRGDGVAHHLGRAVFLPFTAPGDRIRARLGPPQGEGRAGQILEILTAGERASPACPHFGRCGGCALQHLSASAYGAAKEAWLRAALRQHGLPEGSVAPLNRLGPGNRRRVRFAIARPRRATEPAAIGFHARARHDIVDMQACAVLDPRLLALLPPLRRLAIQLWPPGGSGAATAVLTGTGVDLLLDLQAPPNLDRLEAMAEFAAALDLARLAWRLGKEPAMPVAVRRQPRVSFATVEVDLPSDAFLQASVEAEAALVAAVLDGAGEARRVADLFAGLGTFAFALARRAKVHAVEGDVAALAALRAAAARHSLAGRVGSEARDLERQPLAPAELAEFDVVVFDPPRAGARAQCAALARSRVPRLVAVSCNPASFARDARILVDGGYRLAAVQPIDAFLWSAQLELVACFERQ